MDVRRRHGRVKDIDLRTEDRRGRLGDRYRMSRARIRRTQRCRGSQRGDR
ncbi:hypothetical protein DB31_4781 [Hyalangium minutum]|uniref:Uncharacterized protein n=1 Tax=Hyalangium minutum TaxID=394096 RepID=A0A085VZK5_9BACT|nr:hypothetical protein DB31_4781 [Hyalangium minutum]